APTSTVAVRGLKARVTARTIVLASRVTVSEPGRIVQTATTTRRIGKGSRSRTTTTTLCRTTRTVKEAGTHALRCTLGAKARRALRTGALRLTVKTTIRPDGGTATSTTRKLTVGRRA
ncbi:MAG: hypothetical protein ACKO7Q_04960, partial [Actinomycetota bacterium]